MSPEHRAHKRRYSRHGTVEAHRLDAARDWVTTEGDVLRSEAGDWWVVSSSGGGRGVSASEFPCLYEQVEGATYRRIGEVGARQVARHEQLKSLEGDLDAAPGTWIVTDDRGNSWVVPDSVFRHDYAPVDPDA